MKTPIWLLAAVLVPLPLFGAKAPPQVVVSSEVVQASGSAQPGESAPKRFVLYVEPFSEIGGVVRGSKTPAPEAIARAVAGALPGYKYIPLAVSDGGADVVIVCHWGEVSASGPQRPLTAREGGTIPAMRAILVGRTHVPPFMSNTDSDTLRYEGTQDRYFLVVSSYDAAALREGNVSILWQTRVSADSLRSASPDIWKQLANTAGTYFDRPLDRPLFVSAAPADGQNEVALPAVTVEQIAPGATALLSFEKALPKK